MPLFVLQLASAAGATEDISPAIEKHLADNPELPSLAAIVIVDGEYRAAGAAGVRKMGDETAATIDDKYHLGSCSKAFTAVLAAKLVEEGKLSWDSTVGDTLSRLDPHEGYEPATLKQLVSNTAGFPTDIPSRIWAEAWKAKGDPVEQRVEFARAMLALEPSYSPGSQNEYSNTGFAIAGVMMEEEMRKSWEDLVRENIFEPLGMKSAGFYAPATNGDDPDQPLGHDREGNPVPPGEGSDNPAAIAPAGAIHCALPDLVPWLKMHIDRTAGPVLSKPETFAELHTPVEGDYAMGWIGVNRPWAGGTALHHVGSNTMFTVNIWIAPEKRFAVAVASNIGSDIAFGTTDALVGDLIGKYLK